MNMMKNIHNIEYFVTYSSMFRWGNHHKCWLKNDIRAFASGKFLPLSNRAKITLTSFTTPFQGVKRHLSRLTCQVLTVFHDFETQEAGNAHIRNLGCATYETVVFMEELLAKQNADSRMLDSFERCMYPYMCRLSHKPNNADDGILLAVWKTLIAYFDTNRKNTLFCR